MITRRKLLRVSALAAPAIISGGWFPHGKTSGNSPPVAAITLNVSSYGSGWATIANGGNFTDATMLNNANAIVVQAIADWKAWFTTPNGVAITIPFSLDFAPNAALANSINGSYFWGSYTGANGILDVLTNKLPQDSFKLATYYNPPNINTNAALPASDPFSAGSNWVVEVGLEAIWKSNWRYGAGTTAADIVMSSTFINSFDFTNTTGVNCQNGKYSFYSILNHELAYIFGHYGPSIGSPMYPAPYSLFAYSAAGTRNNTYGATRYTSYDGGATNYGNLTVNDPEVASISGTSTLDGTSFLCQTGVTGNGGANPIYWKPQDFKMLSLYGNTLTAAGRTMAGI